jgi:isoleucyl-tRNA synthetase
MKVIKNITDFVSDDLSNWYIRRARRRFYAEGMTEDKKAVYLTTYEILKGVSLLSAPFAPFISDEMYTKLTGEYSVHLAAFPKCDESLIDDELEKKMDLVRAIVTLGRGEREKEKIKVRQPLTEILVDGKYEAEIGNMVPLILEELNVKKVVFENNIDTFMNYSLKPDFRKAGPVIGKNIKEFGNVLASGDAKAMIAELNEKGKLTLTLGGEPVDITEELIDVRISAKEGFAVGTDKGVFVILDTKITPELESEGLARELVSKIQQMRKQKDFDMMDNINISVNCDEASKAAFESHREYIMSETLAKTLEYTAEALEIFKLNGHETGISIEKVEA